MTKLEFYEELRKIGVDVTDPEQMKIWSVALLNMGQKMIEGRAERCETCYFANKAVDPNTKKINPDICSNQFCPVKNMPKTPAEAIETMFARGEPLNMSIFFDMYVKPILDKLIEEEKKKI